jgi:hypothetical protein
LVFLKKLLSYICEIRGNGIKEHRTPHPTPHIYCPQGDKVEVAFSLMKMAQERRKLSQFAPGSDFRRFSPNAKV